MKIKEEEKLDVYYTLKDTIFNAKATFNEDPDQGNFVRKIRLGIRIWTRKKI